MIKSLDLTFFRQHESLHIDFTTGLNVLRGPNESGKSTILEGVLYALFGTKTLRDPLDQTVTWGHKENELKVVLVINISGTDYTFKRGKSGAEVYSVVRPDGVHAAGGVSVTGQAEVSKYAAELLGADAKTAAMMMMATQSDLRGALDEGPSAVSSLMGKLADFDMIDRLMEKAQSNLLLGSEAPFAKKLADAQAELDVAKNEAVSEDQSRYYDSLVTNSKVGRDNIEHDRVTRLLPRVDVTYSALAQAVNSKTQRTATATEIAGLEMTIQEVVKLREKAHAIASTKPTDDALRHARDAAAASGKVAEQLTAYNLVQKLPAFPAEFWEGPKSDFDAEMIKAQADIRRLSDAVQTERALAAGVRRGKITSGKCPTCGVAARSDEHVREHNEKIEAEAVKHDQAAATHDEAAREPAETLAALQRVTKVAAPFEAAASRLANTGMATIDLNTYPPRITWDASVPGTVDVVAAQRAVSTLEQLQSAALRAEGQIESYDATIAETKAKLQQKQIELAGMPAIDTSPLHTAYEAATQAHQAAESQVKQLDAELVEFTRLRDGAVQAYQASQARIAAVTHRIVEIRKDLETLSFNNGLVKKLKTLKPAITDHLWNTVLAAVSNFFTQLRGEQSVVSKDVDGFKVNGHAVGGGSLSGSALDVLALAIRVALTKTFIPHTSLLVLDEPAAACDVSRTGNLLGFLSSVGFTQTLLASHDELSESVAENVINLGD